MGYIQIFGEKLDQLLVARGVADSDREEIIAYVQHIVLESYNNGRAAGTPARTYRSVRAGGGKKPPGKPRREKYEGGKK